MLSASEIGAFVFCPQAWYLERRGARRTDHSARRLRQGTLAHRRIGRRTDRWRAAESVRRVLVAVIVVLVAGLAIQVMNAAVQLRP